MAIIETYDGGVIHTAYADDDTGTNFSLTEYTDAAYIGTYIDKSTTESTSPQSYTWTMIGDDSDEIDEDDVEESDETDARLDSVEAATVNNSGTVQDTQGTTDAGLGNVNELEGTNKGTENWTVSGDTLTLSSGTESIYDETADPVEYMRVTCSTAGTAYITFPADELSAKLANADSGDVQNTFTFSADVRMSELFEIPTVAVQETDGTGVQITFDAIDLTETDRAAEVDSTGAWEHVTSTATGTGTAQGTQVLFFDLSSMPAEATFDIVNLKIESGALATEWRQSTAEIAAAADEAMIAADNAATAASAAQDSADSAASAASTAQTTAETAQSAAEAAQATADNINLHFWYDDDGAHVSQLENDLTGSHTDIVDTGLNVKVGDTTLAAFDSDGITFADSTQTLFEMESGTDDNYTYTYLRNPVALTNLGMGHYTTTDGTLTELSLTTGDYNSQAAKASALSLGVYHTTDTSGSDTTLYGMGVSLSSSDGRNGLSIFSSSTLADGEIQILDLDDYGNLNTGGIVNNTQAGTVKITPTGSKSHPAFGSTDDEFYEGSATVTFDTPFDTKPIVTLTINTPVPWSCIAGATKISTTGFTIKVGRTSKTSTFVMWQAMAATQ